MYKNMPMPKPFSAEIVYFCNMSIVRAKKSLGQHFEETYGIHEDTSIAEAIGIVQSIEIPQAERESLIQKMTA